MGAAGATPRLQAAGRRCGAGALHGKRRRGERARRTGSGDGSARMAAAMTAAAAAGGGGAGAARSLSRFRGCLAGALLGDCVGSFYEAHSSVTLTSVLRHVQSLEPEPGAPGSAQTGGRGPGAAGPGLRGPRAPRLRPRHPHASPRALLQLGSSLLAADRARKRRGRRSPQLRTVELAHPPVYLLPSSWDGCTPAPVSAQRGVRFSKTKRV